MYWTNLLYMIELGVMFMISIVQMIKIISNRNETGSMDWLDMISKVAFVIWAANRVYEVYEVC